MPQDSDWAQTDGWLAALREEDHADQGDDGRAEAAVRAEEAAWAEEAARAEAAARVQAAARAEIAARAEAAARVQAAARAEAAAHAEAAARAEAAAHAASTVRAVIGDELRMPIMWCEMGSCVSWYADPAALGEADNRARAIKAGWRIDAVGRRACPSCQQTDVGFWATDPVVPWDRHTAIARAAAVSRDRTAAARGSGDNPGHAVGGHPAARPPHPRRHQPAPPSPRLSP
jgi:hypothetical protein